MVAYNSVAGILENGLILEYAQRWGIIKHQWAIWKGNEYVIISRDHLDALWTYHITTQASLENQLYGSLMSDGNL